ncbi:hypothetical protein [Sphingomonas sp.]|uniref:hypothetical protein n=1 Tax=Sphingomonas sp. TaxID=28214 RepID=UPI00286DF5F9|nr:hypothetical protein [Sphingomonas sp.]
MAKQQRDPVPPLEWAAAAFGLVAALLLLGIIGREAVAGNDESVPVLVAEVERVAATPTGHVVEFRVRNLAGQTVAAVQVEGTINPGPEEEVSSASIDYVPGRSQASGGLIFTNDPRSAELELRVTGYEIP